MLIAALMVKWVTADKIQIQQKMMSSIISMKVVIMVKFMSKWFREKVILVLLGTIIKGLKSDAAAINNH